MSARVAAENIRCIRCSSYQIVPNSRHSYSFIADVLNFVYCSFKFNIAKRSCLVFGTYKLFECTAINATVFIVYFGIHSIGQFCI